MKKQQPYMPLYVGDFWASVADWKGEASCLYLGLLTYQWSMGSLPNDPDELCLLMRYKRDSFDKLWPKVSSKFKLVNGRLVNQRLEHHRAKAIEKSAKNAQSGKKGGSTPKGSNGSERLSETEANANTNAIANASETLKQLRNETEANASNSLGVSLVGSLNHPNLNQSKPELRVLSKERNLG